MASEQGHHSIVKKLLESNANIEQAKNSGSTPIYAASQNGHPDIVQTLLNAGVKNLHGFKIFSILHAASKKNHHEVVKVILNNSKGRDLIDDATNNFNDTPLTYAIQCDADLNLVKLLINAGANYMKLGDGSE